MPGAGSVSAIITAFECARYLPEAIESVLAQTHPVDEIIVVDDGSTDDCPAVVASFGSRIRGVRQPNSGIGSARNRGIAESRGEWIAFLDGDDVWEPEKTALQFRVAAERPSPDLIFGLALNFVSPEIDPAEAARWRAPEGEIAGLVAGAMLVRRRVVERIGEYRTDLKLGEFIDWIARAHEIGLTEVVIPNRVLRRRLHGGNQTLRHRNARSDYAKVLKASLDRRRAGA